MVIRHRNSQKEKQTNKVGKNALKRWRKIDSTIPKFLTDLFNI